MENKINIAKLLKDCPKGMELDCTMFDNVTFVRVDDKREQFPIKITVGGLRSKYLTKDGCFHDNTLIPEAKCVIFPKGKTTWEGFHRPFKDGDIVFYNDTIAIFKEWGDETLFRTYVTKYLCCDSLIDTNVPLFGKSVRKEIRLATEEEKQKLFDAIKANGYRWDEETKTLEKLPKFKVGDRIRHRLTGEVYMVLFVLSNGYGGGVYDVAVTNEIGKSIDIKEQDNYELVPDKFDITTLKPFDKVLFRMHDKDTWCNGFYGFYINNRHLVNSVHTAKQCVPYEANKELLGTTNDCDDFYKTWEK